ncbi:DUF3152 domain-containing protein [Streptomyces sp. S1]|uniref:DUF3152 domain-containing protein n=1 Tax=Streptomyces sp. S1 TaxID=718288 RepID=UPI003D75AC89
MGRHSRKGAAPSPADTGRPPAAGQQRTAPEPAASGPAPGTGRRRRSATAADDGRDPTGTPPRGTPPYGKPPQGKPPYGAPAQGSPAYGTPVHGTPMYGTPAHGTPMYGTPAHGTPVYGTPAHGTPVQGTPAHGTPVYGTPAHGIPVHGTPAHGTPVHGGPPQGPPGRRGPRHGAPAPATAPAATAPASVSDTPAHGTPGTPAHGIPVHRAAAVRGGHPQHDEGGARPVPYGGRRGRTLSVDPERADEQGPFVPGPRHEDEPEAEVPAGRGGLGRTLAGVAAAAVATVLAVVVAGQVTGQEEPTAAPRAAGEAAERAVDESSASRSDDRITPTRPVPRKPVVLTYEQLMTHQFPIDPELKGSGAFEAVQGFQKAPGKGRLIRYRVDVEKGIGLDPKLFADAVQKTLNDPRSWAGDGAMTFERISSGEPEFVITLASPGTTGVWCRKSGLDTTIDNVSCDSASTERVMINAFRWAQGSSTFGPKAMRAYRQMLINHEVGHRLGHNHVTCRTPGALAPVMQQQTKSLNIDGVRCRPNPWVNPGS